MITMDYKAKMVELLNKMHEDKMTGCIPMVMAEAVKDCNAAKAQPYLDYYVARAFYGQ